MVDRSLFAWYGFSFEHPDDWAPVTISGNRSEGYVRLASAGRVGCQVRWKQVKEPGDLGNRLSAYLAKLEREARRRKELFRSDIKHEPDAVTYRVTAGLQARGAIFFSKACSRVFFIEASGGRADSLLPVYRSLKSAFCSFGVDALEPWSILGLHVRLPYGLRIDRKMFVSGRTRLELSRRGVSIEVERWGFARQLIDRHGLEAWAVSALKLPRGTVETDGPGVRVQARTRLGVPIHAMVAYDEASNRLTSLKIATKKDDWMPEWDWIPLTWDYRAQLPERAY